MGFFDNANAAFNKEAAKMSRSVKAASLGAQLKDLERQRETAASQLGAALYLHFRNNPETRNIFEAMFNRVEDVDEQIRAIKSEIALLERQNSYSAPGKRVCPQCGQIVSPKDIFCSGCGERVEQQPSNTERENCCENCGAPYEPGQLFCMRCGSKLS
ncbi:zinc ribbon domain-containing protein [Ellagibacter isourolithinifaciens]|uniref:zinc ribbon domain-containing protein n=1 Tax=Ellagibacter isourolithinifaciens TaxID=2137581 RepID=UPI003AAD5054